MNTTPQPPIPYETSMETVAEDEAETIEALKHELLKISKIVADDSGHAMRSVHAKGHGLLSGQLTVFEGLPEPLAQGLFGAPGSYAVLMRLSTPPGDVLADSVSVPRALALQVQGVPGQRLPGDEAGTTQDFVMANGPVFLAPDAKHFLSSLKLLASTTDKAEGLKKALSAALRGTEKLLEAFGKESGTLKAMGGHPMTHILGETFYIQAPILFGRYVAKLALMPVSQGLLDLKDMPLDLRQHPDGLRDAVREFFAVSGGEWELRAQLCTNRETMPVEDPSVPWPETESPYIAVARIVVGPQVSWNDSITPGQEDALSFSPWHGIAEHRPLGSVMRARKDTYRASAEFRGACPYSAATSMQTPAQPAAQAFNR